MTFFYYICEVACCQFDSIFRINHQHKTIRKIKLSSDQSHTYSFIKVFTHQQTLGYLMFDCLKFYSVVSWITKTMKSFCRIFTLLALIALIDGFKVLGVLPFGSKSHFAIGNGIVKTLHKAGHDVTVISPYPLKKPLERYRDVSTKELLDAYAKGILCWKWSSLLVMKFLTENPLNMFEFGGMDPTLGTFFLYKMGNDLVNSVLSYPRVQKFLEEDQKFDVCVFEIFNADALLVSLILKLKIS